MRTRSEVLRDNCIRDNRDHKRIKRGAKDQVFRAVTVQPPQGHCPSQSPSLVNTDRARQAARYPAYWRSSQRRYRHVAAGRYPDLPQLGPRAFAGMSGWAERDAAGRADAGKRAFFVRIGVGEGALEMGGPGAGKRRQAV